MSRQLTLREYRTGKSVLLRATPSRAAGSWVLDLNCGHQVWVIQRATPKLDKLVTCPTCSPHGGEGVTA